MPSRRNNKSAKTNKVTKTSKNPVTTALRSQSKTKCYFQKLWHKFKLKIHLLMNLDQEKKKRAQPVSLAISSREMELKKIESKLYPKKVEMALPFTEIFTLTSLMHYLLYKYT